MSKLLKKVLKNSILPASLMVAGKVVGLYLAAHIFSLDIFIESEVNSFFSINLYSLNPSDTLLLNTFSDGVMLVSIVVGYIILLAKYVLFTSAQQNPRTLIKVTKLNLLNWITNQDTSFIKVFIWTVFFWGSSLVVITNALTVRSYMWLGVSAFIFVVFSTWILIRTFDTETNKIYPKEKNNYI